MWHLAQNVPVALEVNGIHPYPLLTALRCFYLPAESVSRHGQRPRVPALSRSKQNISCTFLDM